jgi:hypothetical protein
MLNQDYPHFIRSIYCCQFVNLRRNPSKTQGNRCALALGNGSFEVHARLDVASYPDGSNFRVGQSYADFGNDKGTVGGFISVNVAAAVTPEPASLAPIALGMAGLLFAKVVLQAAGK